MYFKQPRQLLDIFEELEEQNLFLIQNCQETERQVEELKQQFADTQTETDAKATAQRKQIRELNKAIDEEEAKKEKLELRMASAGTDSAQAELLRKSNDTTARVYEQCGFGEGGGQTLTMLADLEARLEQPSYGNHLRITSRRQKGARRRSGGSAIESRPRGG